MDFPTGPLSYQDLIAKLYYHPEKRPLNIIQCPSVTFQVTDDCNLRCSYCYQINKGHHKMPFSVAKDFIDLLFENSEQTQQYIDTNQCDGIILEFIGGEPFLEVKLIDQIIEYFQKTAILHNHIWARNWQVSISTNGTLYFNPDVQKFIKKYFNRLSLSITVDGNKQLHDACRKFPSGEGSYDLASAAAYDFMYNLHGNLGSKITLSPDNIEYLSDAIKDFIFFGYKNIFANCVFEDVWEIEHATILYNELKKIADYLLKNNLEQKIFFSLFKEKNFCPLPEDDTSNWCWGAGTPVLTINGYQPIETLKIGDFVYTADGSIHPIINTTSHFAENCVILHNSGTFDLVCTDNHQIYAKPFDYIGNKNKKHWKQYGKYKIKELSSKDYLELFKLPEGTTEISYDFAYLVGRYIGDGWDTRNGQGHHICCSFEETEELINYFNKANIKYTINKNKTVNQFNIIQHKNNTQLHNILKQCGHLALNKRVPKEVFTWSIQGIKALLDGYIDADGYINTSGQYRINTVSYELAEEIMLLLRTVGYTPTCYKKIQNKKSFILGREVNIHDRYEIYFYLNPNRSKYVKHTTEDNKLWTSHLKIIPTESQQVYNITVDTNHSYIAGGLVSSNCGGNAQMLALDYQGYIYPCVRYMASSLGNNVKPVIVGNVKKGFMSTEEEKQCINCLKIVNRISQSTKKCIECPVAKGCAWCQAYNYQCSRNFDYRAIGICNMHKATALANTYYWNKCYQKNNINEKMHLYLEENDALKIITEDEYKKIKSLELL